MRTSATAPDRAPASVDRLARRRIGEQLGAELLFVEAERDAARVRVVRVVHERAPEPLALRGDRHRARTHRGDHRLELGRAHRGSAGRGS